MFVKANLPEGLMPFWAVNNISDATNNKTVSDDYNSATQLEQLAAGILPSTCPTPCVSTTTHTVSGPIAANYKDSFIHIVFDQKITVEQTVVDSFSIMACLNFLGSNLGLWPGLGIFQILQLLVKSPYN